MQARPATRSHGTRFGVGTRQELTAQPIPRLHANPSVLDSLNNQGVATDRASRLMNRSR